MAYIEAITPLTAGSNPTFLPEEVMAGSRIGAGHRRESPYPLREKPRGFCEKG